MNSYRPILTQHRLRRLALWTLMVLHWIAAILFADSRVTPRHLEQRLDLISLPWLTRRVSQLLIVRAGQLAGRRRRRRIVFWRYGRDLRRAHLLRSALGRKLHRALGHKDAATWIANLIAVLRNLDAYAAPLARRLRRGLTRLWRILPPIAPAAALYGAPASPLAAADSS